MQCRGRRVRRRGVLLLVVLSMLVLFLMIGTAFIITAKQSERAAKTAQRATMRLSSESATGDLLDQAILQLIRDTNNANSAMRHHSLLGDIYGNDGFTSQVAVPDTQLRLELSRNGVTGQYLPPASGNLKTQMATTRWPRDGAGAIAGGGQILEFDLVWFRDQHGNVAGAWTPTSPATLVPNPAAPSAVDNALAGQVLTFTSGQFKGRSTRIVTSQHHGDRVTVRVMSFPLNNGRIIDPRLNEFNDDADLTPLFAGARVVVNGREFNGTGAGLNRWADPEGAALNAEEEVMPGAYFPLALMPHSRYFLSASFQPPTIPLDVRLPPPPNTLPQPPQFGYFPTLVPGSFVRDYVGRGGVDEPYDAPDFQNMALAYVPNVPVGKLIETVWQVTADPMMDPLPHLTTPPGLNGLSQVDPNDLSGLWQAMVLPSWHRPDLLHFTAWQTAFAPPATAPPNDVRYSTLASNPLMLRRVMLRPNWLDHPRFDGSNPELAVISPAAANHGARLARMIYGPWDVDNDNDGVRDSVWIDAGLPVIAGPNGKLVKPMVAMLVIDLDGRLNVNAHGSLDLASLQDSSALNGTGLRMQSTTAPLAGATSDQAPHGLGFGPADISLAPALGDDFGRLLRGDRVTVGPGQFVDFPGRYGYANTTTGGTFIRPGIAEEFDALAQVKLTGWPNRATDVSSFGTPQDLRARYSVGVNKFGQPIFESTLQGVMATASDGLVYDSPYELNLSQKAPVGVTGNANVPASDAPFSLAELERALRVYDADASNLPSRLYYLAGLTDPTQLNDRHSLTTDSFDLPAPSFSVPHEIRDLLAQPTPAMPTFMPRLPRNFGELLETRVRAVRAAITPPINNVAVSRFPIPLKGSVDAVNTEANEIRGIMRMLLAPELASGTRLNVNRPLGNGRDDNNNGVVDEPGEWFDADGDGEITSDGGAGIEYVDRDGDGAYTPTVGLVPGDLPRTVMWGFQPGNFMAAALAGFEGAVFPAMGTEITPDPTYPNGVVRDVDHRQLLARHLYVLALTLTAPENFGMPNTFTPPGDPQRDQEIARRLAQWAVNVVDFRDHDNAMTPFEYDVNPFDGWDLVIDGVANHQYAPDSMIQLVWGAERPELVMTETLAWHDRRTDDTGNEEPYPAEDDPYITKTDDEDDPKRDPDYDSLLRPRGALFVEVHNPWPTSPGAAADTHAIGLPPNMPARTDMGVNLAAVVPGVEPADQSPVWRITIYKRGSVRDTDTATWDPDHPDPARRPKVPADRTIYFAGKDPEVLAKRRNREWDDDGVAFFNDPTKNPVPPVRPGRYLVIGGGRDADGDGVYEVPIGDRKDRGSNGPVRRIVLDTNNSPHKVRVMDADDTTVMDAVGPGAPYALESPAEAANRGLIEEAYPNDQTASVTDVAIIDRVVDGAGGTKPRPLSISEPAQGYPDKFRAAVWNEAEQQYKAEGASKAIDIPLDGPLGGEAALAARESMGAMRDGNWPSYLARFNTTTRKWEKLLDEVLCQIPSAGSSRAPGASYGHIYLQRLANPLAPWNPPQGDPKHRANLAVNPYLTVDSSTANLSVFNSRGDDGGREEPEPDHPDGKDANEARAYLASHERGYTAAKLKESYRVNPWVEETLATETNKQTPIKSFKPPQHPDPTGVQLAQRGNYWFNAVPFGTVGFLNRTFQDPNAAPEQRKLQPAKPFPWLAWNNRPFASGNELIHVPRMRSSQLMEAFTTHVPEGAPAPPAGMEPPSPYEGPSGELNATTGRPTGDVQPPFAHLENFFFSHDHTAPIPRGVVSHMYRVLDYVHTPSLFVGTETWLNPTPVGFGGDISGVTGNVTDVNARQLATMDPRLSLRPPFNVVSEFRDPGRVNLNTISGATGAGASATRAANSDVWNGIFHAMKNAPATRDPDRKVESQQHAGPPWMEFTQSRSGYDGGQFLEFDAAFPTMFANPFRPADSRSNVPLPSMLSPLGVPPAEAEDIDVTLLRRVSRGGEPERLFDVEPSVDYSRPDLNQYFDYQPITRLGSLVTTRSNVFAVWVTIGFFEVEEAEPTRANFVAEHKRLVPTMTDDQANAIFDRVYPDGYMFGKEDGLDTGNVRRLRGFYIIDRTMPAAFEPGVDHNVEDVIRLRRRIE